MPVAECYGGPLDGERVTFAWGERLVMVRHRESGRVAVVGYMTKPVADMYVPFGRYVCEGMGQLNWCPDD